MAAGACYQILSVSILQLVSCIIASLQNAYLFKSCNLQLSCWHRFRGEDCGWSSIHPRVFAQDCNDLVYPFHFVLTRRRCIGFSVFYVSRFLVQTCIFVDHLGANDILISLEIVLFILRTPICVVLLATIFLAS